MGWQLATQSTQLVQNKQKNETTAGVALVLAAAVGFTMHVGHKLLGEEGVGELHQHLVAPVPDRRPSSPDTPDVAPNTGYPQHRGPAFHRDPRQSPELRPPPSPPC